MAELDAHPGAGGRVHEVDDPPPGGLLPGRVQPGAAGGDAARLRHAHHLGHHRPAPPSALLPRCTRWKSPGTPSLALYMSIGETITRLARSSRPIRPGWNIGGRTSGRAGRSP